MRVILAAALAFWLTGCVLKKTPNAVAATPVAPKPTPAPPAAPPPPPEPLSIHQTSVDLPAVQPISQEALNTTQLPEESVPPQTKNPYRGNRGGGKNPTTATAPSRAEAPKPEAPKPEAAKPDSAAPVATSPQIRPIVPAEEQQQFKQRADEVRRETNQRIANVRGHNVELNKIQEFLSLSTDAEKRSDMRQAYEMAEKALVLAKDLTGGK